MEFSYDRARKIWPFNRGERHEIFYDRTRKRWPFNTGDPTGRFDYMYICYFFIVYIFFTLEWCHNEGLLLKLYHIFLKICNILCARILFYLTEFVWMNIWVTIFVKWILETVSVRYYLNKSSSYMLEYSRELYV